LKKITKTDSEWRSELGEEKYQVLRKKATDRPFTGEYVDNKEPGTYYCAGCGNALFEATTKFDSGSGWPSFFEPLSQESVREESDSSHGMQRLEALCNKCGGHLGHIFPDGPNPTGLRYCINSNSLTFKKLM
jgi:peptide-methionine (R)-S-oxide reductase